MISYLNKHEERRSSQGLSQPVIFLLFEIVFFAIIIFFISKFNIFELTIISVLVSIYLFINSSLVRFKIVCERQ